MRNPKLLFLVATLVIVGGFIAFLINQLNIYLGVVCLLFIAYAMIDIFKTMVRKYKGIRSFFGK